MRVYELLVGPSGAKLDHQGSGFHFHGDMHEFADLLAVQFTIPAAPSNDPTQPARATATQTPVLDRTGLTGIYDFGVDMHPELGTDMFTLWDRALREQLGLRLTSRRNPVRMLVVDSSDRVPSAN